MLAHVDLFYVQRYPWANVFYGNIHSCDLHFSILPRGHHPSYARTDLSNCENGVFFNHSLDELDLGCLDVDDPPLALEEALELRWEDIALEVERRRAL